MSDQASRNKPGGPLPGEDLVRSPAGGVQGVADMMNALDEPTRQRLMGELAARDPSLVEEIRLKMFTFEDLARGDDETLRKLLHEIPQGKWAMALRKASDELKAALFRNLSTRAATALKEAIEDVGPRKLSDVLAVQAEIVDQARPWFQPKV